MELLRAKDRLVIYNFLHAWYPMDKVEERMDVAAEGCSDRSVMYIICALIFSAIVVVFVALDFYQKRRVRNNSVEELTRYADSLVGQQLSSTRDVLADLAQNPHILHLVSSQEPQSSHLEKYLTGVAAGSRASIVYIMNTEGTVIGCSRYGEGKTLLGNNYSFREYFTGALEGEEIVFPAVGKTTNERGFYFSSPIYTAPEKTEVAAVVVIKMGVRRLEKILLSMESPTGMVTPDGIIFISNKNDLLYRVTRQIPEEKITEIIASQQFGDNSLEPVAGHKVLEDGWFGMEDNIVERVGLLFPGWALVQWRDLRYPYKLAIFISLPLSIIISFMGLLVVGRRNRQRKDQELLIAKEMAEENLRQGYETLRHILRSSPVAVFLCDRESGISWLNKTARKMLGLSDNEEAKAYSFGENIDVVDDDGTSLIADKEGKIMNTEGRFKVTTGIDIPVLLNRTSFSRGEQEMLLFSFLDLSERKQMEAELVHTRKMESIGQLAAGIAHEINSPAQFVASNLEFIIDSLQDLFSLIEGLENVEETGLNSIEEALKKNKEEVDYDYLQEELPLAAQQSRTGIERISKIVLAMKAFSHPGESNALQFSDINEAIETTLTVSGNEWRSIADVELELAPELPAVPCQIGEINQVFLNLIVNGAHAIEEKQKRESKFTKGVLRITTSVEGEYVKITFSDSGTGIPEDCRSKIFDPFFTTKEVGKGSGQGLYIASTLIQQQHQGILTFSSEVGKGTTFTILLPFEQEKEA